ncbi:MAG TPA: hypothetical protein PKN99_01100 [Cyclobacteriaceae bacterium]|jgi:hypothetical protein|nr:hypothetical protein [Cyclobacteriaceae bacterium]
MWGKAPQRALMFYVMLVIAYHLVGEDPWRNDGKDKKGDYN